MIRVPCNMTEEERAGCETMFKPIPYKEREAMKRAFMPYLFYETWGRKDLRECCCQRCGRFELERSRTKDIYYDDPFDDHHGEQTACPMCGEQVELVCLGRMRNMRSLSKTKNVVLLQAAEDGTLLIRAGVAVREFAGRDDLDPTPEFYEKRRYALRQGKRQSWIRWDWWYEAGAGRGKPYRQWQPMKTCGEPFAPKGYFGNGAFAYIVGAEAVERSELRYSAAETYMNAITGVWITEDECWPGSELRGLVTYLCEYSRRPQLEMLTKLGFTDVVSRHLEQGIGSRVNWRAKTPHAFFRMDKADFRVFRDEGVSFADVDKYRTRGETAREMDLQGYLAARSFLAGRADDFFTLCEGRGLRAVTALKYIQDQAPIGDDGRTTFTLWRDYLENAEKLERDITFRRNLFPENLREEHDGAAETVRRLAEKKENEGYGRGRFRRLKRRYAWSDGELCITVPVNAEDIRQEGQTLRHCVAGYAERHIQGRTTILFLRRCDAPTERYVTVEIDDATLHIRQAHGYRNEFDGAEPPMQRHKAFFDAWLAWLRAGSPRSRNGKPVRVKTEKEARTA